MLKAVYPDVKNFSCQDLYLRSTDAPSGPSIWRSREQLHVRIDDKLNRLMKGTDYPGDNDIDDLIGYLVLLKIAKTKSD
jgi:hypothetical protein